MIEFRRWDDLAVAYTFTIPRTGYNIDSWHCSPDGRWLVVGQADEIIVLD
ncbi:MAG TPA: hypothetical protein VKY19_26890 [Ktedonosporobacter sp.]|jgi:hypothetical protein|nr:hypothetical protein [Ktedonosporobacter sp.]